MIKFNGDEIGSFKNQKELKEGNEFELDASRKLGVKLLGNVYPELDLTINGNVIKGSPTDPFYQLNQVLYLAITLGALNIILGLIAEVLKIEILLNLGLGLVSIFIGAIIIGLAFGVKKRSYLALSLIMIIIILDIAASFYFAINAELGANPTNGILVKLFFLIYLSKGFSAIKKVKEKASE